MAKFNRRLPIAMSPGVLGLNGLDCSIPRCPFGAFRLDGLGSRVDEVPDSCLRHRRAPRVVFAGQHAQQPTRVSHRSVYTPTHVKQFAMLLGMACCLGMNDVSLNMLLHLPKV